MPVYVTFRNMGYAENKDWNKNRIKYEISFHRGVLSALLTAFLNTNRFTGGDVNFVGFCNMEGYMEQNVA